MPTRPNPPADAEKMRTLTGPDNTPEEQMTTNEDLDTSGAGEVRVDCNCSRYSRETVSVPHGVVMDALIVPIPVKEMMADERITATKIASSEPRRPSADFKQVHLAQIAASMRIKRLIPFSPFVANAEHLRTRESFATWRKKYYAQLPDGSRLRYYAQLPDGSRLSVPSENERVTTSAASTEQRDTADPGPTAPEADWSPADPEPMIDDSFKVLNARDLRKWIGKDPGRARRALDHEMRRDAPRSTVIAHVAKVGGEP